ncbi:Eco57I restriction-modification methylase domain-containing protein [Haloarcula salinisoli]|uniref:site-specific DNA-methyltransferase (adenine-specific) n=1 Tax=Haloarcula salinisoli TaxID=2487746 RepID=A0A8J7YGW7_9EURY|nr:TaqI-like C-terminal specificity domain-containing protein [Halomicroarcula salinisoli]MBX0305282.1 N-6 DNA methylase [Halomicroarcula salinisoli]
MSQATLSSTPYRNSSLFSGYYLDERIDDLEEWECDDEAEEAFEALQHLWDLEGELVSSYNEDELLDSWIDEVLDVLGFGTLSETTLPDSGGYNDRLLFESDEKRRDAAKRKRDGETEAMYGLASAVLEAKQWDADFTKRFNEQRSYRDASHQIKYYLEHTPERLKWGILTDGKKWRLYGTKDYATEIYYEVDLPELLESGDLEQFKYFYTFFRPAAFREVAGTSFLDTVWNESETAAQELGEDLQDNVFTALRILGEGFIHTNDLDIDPDDEDAREELKEQSLVLLYRLMFVLYAESRGLIHPDDPEAQAEFEEHFSLDQIRLEIHEDITSGDSYDDYSGYATQIWGQLEDLFGLVDEGKEKLGIPPYNGGLFDEETHEFLAENEVADRYIAEVIHRLGTTEGEDGNPVLADYADLDTRHLGSIYEGLLEHEFRIASEPYAAVAEDGGQVWKPGTEVSVADAVETVEKGELYVVNDDGERKATGAYYTPDYVVSYIVEETVDPLLDDIKADLEADGLEPSDTEYFRRFWQEVLDLKILDPAMGSAHFLTSATGYLTEQVMEVVREQEIQSYDEQELRRTIAKECIYGVDVNGMAVELGKLSMWLETLAADKPLAFLDHHLKAGNSLVGSDISEVLSDDTEENGGQLTLTQAFARARQQTLEHVMDLMEDLLAIDNDDLADIKSMEEIYEEIREDPLYQRLFEIANVHTAEAFGLDVPEGVYEEMAGAIEDSDEWAEIQGEDWFTSAQAMADEEDFFHWELEFPEVFFGEDGERLGGAGFDAVVGNPPYVSNWELTENHSISPRTYENMYPEPAVGHWDLYILFCYRATELTRYGGNHSFITPSSLKTEKYARALRNYFIENTHIVRLVDFGELEVFTGVDRQCVIYTVSKSTSDEETQIVGYSDLSYNQLFALDQDTFTEYKHSAFRVNLSPEDLELKNAIERISVSLGSICCVNPGVVAHSGSHSELDFDKEDVLHDSKEGDGFKPYLEGGDIQRYALEWKGRYIDYESKQSHFHRPKYPELFENPKVIFRRISGENNRLISCFDYDKYYTAQRAAHAVNWSPEMEEHRGPADYEATEDANEYDIRYLNAIANSALVGYYFSNFLATGSLQGSYTDVYPEDIRQLPVKEISSDTLNSPQAEYDSNSEQVPTDEKGQYHSLIYLAETIKSRKQSLGELNLSLRDHLGTYSDGPTLADVGLTQPPEGSADSILQETTEQKPNLRIGEVTVIRESGTTVEIRLTARYKPDDEDAYETDQWGYTETDPLPALRITDLTETEADLIEAFVPVAVDEAGGFAGFRETATKTNSLVDRLRKLTLPAVDEVRDGLESYVGTKERAEELEEKIARTDDLIDDIVYELYGLTDEEIEIVEEAIGE